MRNTITTVAAVLALATLPLTGLSSVAEAKGQLSFGISADKNTDQGKALTLIDMIIAHAPLGGKGNHAKVGQHGKNNSAGVAQKGNGNGVGVVQDCNGCSSQVSQNGNNNTQGVLQFGDGASSNVQQTGNNQAGLQIDAGF
jgi:hypothetical protein